VQSGDVDLKVGDHLLTTVSEGAMLGEMAILDDSPRSATAVARTEARLVPVDQQRFLFLVQNTPFFAVDVMKVMAERLRMMDRREAD
jgi:CRP-like cAMP-binding protein